MREVRIRADGDGRMLSHGVVEGISDAHLVGVEVQVPRTHAPVVAKQPLLDTNIAHNTGE